MKELSSHFVNKQLSECKQTAVNSKRLIIKTISWHGAISWQLSNNDLAASCLHFDSIPRAYLNTGNNTTVSPPATTAPPATSPAKPPAKSPAIPSRSDQSRKIWTESNFTRWQQVSSRQLRAGSADSVQRDLKRSCIQRSNLIQQQLQQHQQQNSINMIKKYNKRQRYPTSCINRIVALSLFSSLPRIWIFNFERELMEFQRGILLWARNYLMHSSSFKTKW